MFHRGFRFIVVAAVLAAVGTAPGLASGGGGGSDFESQVAKKAALTLARAADANESGDVTGVEWSAFVASLNPDAAGVISADALIAVLPLPSQSAATSTGGSAFADFVTLLYDRDKDGKIQTWDLASFFALLDTNGDGSISVVEFAAAQGGLSSDQDVKALAVLLAHAADADKSGDVSEFEWGFFLGTLDPDGNGLIDPNALVAALSLAPISTKWWRHDDDDDDDDNDEHGDDDDDDEGDDDDDDSQPSPALTLLVLRLFDRDFDGRIGTDDLNALFALIDTNGDGALSSDEIDAASAVPDEAAQDAARMALLLARAADADDSGNVTADEWTAYLASLNPDPDGVIDFLALVATLPTTKQAAEDGDFDPIDSVQRILAALDRDADGKIETDDLNALFALIDTDGDGAISASEFAAAGGGSQESQDARRLATLLARAADADLSGDVTADEWTAFLASLDPDSDGVIDFVTLVAVLPTSAAKSEPDPAEVVERLLAAFDRDGDGQITTGDLNALFALLDADANGALSPAELVPPKALRRLRAPAVRLLCRAADADHDGRATSGEVAAFFAGIGSDRASGAVDMRDLASKLPPAAARRKAWLARLFDLDRDRVVTLADLHTIFSATDQDADGTISGTEMRRALRHAR